MTRKIVVAMTGASGFAYGVRMLDCLKDAGIETHLVMSRSAKVALAYESEMKVREIEARADVVWSNDDVGAAPSSGSFRTEGTIIAPCSAKTLGEIASGACGTLVSRIADVTLKERRRLVLLFRETPLHLGHCRNMTAVTEYGAIDLWGKNVRERAMALIDIAHPDFRAELLTHARKRHYVT